MEGSTDSPHYRLEFIFLEIALKELAKPEHTLLNQEIPNVP